jgi:RNA polymerase-binding protein DksA
MAARSTSAKKAAKQAVATATRRTPTSASTTKKSRPSTKKTVAKKAAPTKKATTRQAKKAGPTRKAAPAKASAKKAPPAKKTTAKQAAPAKKTTTKKAAPAKKSPAKKAAAKKAAPARNATAKQAPAAKKAVAKKPTVPKASSTTRLGTTTKTSRSAPKAPARKAAPVKMETGTATAPARKGKAGKLAVREGEKPWTAGEIKQVKATLEEDAARLKAEIAATEEEIGHLLREGGEGAGNDQADVGSNTFERDHEMTMAKNARESLHIIESALARIEDRTYGICESCGRPIGKMRLQAFPRATLCMECKQRQERR